MTEVIITQADIDAFKAIFDIEEPFMDIEGDDARVLEILARHRIESSPITTCSIGAADAGEPSSNATVNKVATSREIMLAGGVDPDAPFEVGPFPSDMRQADTGGQRLEEVGERVAQAVGSVIYGTDTDPFEQPERWEHLEKVATAAIAVLSTPEASEDSGNG